MAQTIGYRVLDRVVQNRDSVDHSYCVGRGKLEDIAEIVKEKKIGTVIFTNTLPSSQIFKIQRRLGNDVKVIDRNLLILELFERRAMTKEAKLQIQLARLRYTFSWGREFLKLQGILGEQVGWSGPGDYPFKEYEKSARKRISKIKRTLDDLRLKKDLLRSRRHELGYPIVALSGYTQSGKTTFFNNAASESKNVGIGPFTTLSTCARKVTVRSFRRDIEFILVDSIGFIEDMHPIIIDAFDSTLNEIANADLMLIFFDITDELATLERKIVCTNEILRRIDAPQSAIICANKVDVVGSEQMERAISCLKNHFIGLDLVQISAKTGWNVPELMKCVASRLRAIESTEEQPIPKETSTPILG